MNCIVICLDTFRADCIRHLGAHENMQTPTLDAMARDGVWFENAFAEALPTVPARRSLFTGIRGFPWRWTINTTGSSPGAPGMPGWHGVPPHQQTLAERLSRAGYATGLVADTYHLFKPTMNFTRGFMNWEFFRGQEADPYRLGNRGGTPGRAVYARSRQCTFRAASVALEREGPQDGRGFHVRQVHAPRHSIHR